jgi:hypothetical protein
MTARTTLAAQSPHSVSRAAKASSGLGRNYPGLLATLGFSAFVLLSAPALAQSLGAAQSFAILGGSAVNANGTGSLVNGDVGVSPGSSITGFPAQANVVPPFSFAHSADGPANNARASTLTLYNFLAAAGGPLPFFPGWMDKTLGQAPTLRGRLFWWLAGPSLSMAQGPTFSR